MRGVARPEMFVSSDMFASLDDLPDSCSYAVISKTRSLSYGKRAQSGVQSVYPVSVGRNFMEISSKLKLTRRSESKPWAMRAASLLCLLLLTLLTFVQVAHVH